MTRKAKIIYIIGSVIIGVVSLLAVLLSLVASGAIDARQTKLVYASFSNEFVYDGQAHGEEGWELISGELREGHSSVVTVSGTQTEVGESSNYFSVVIVDERGADVSGHYEIEYQPGTLRVTPREISVTAGSAARAYDGTALTCESFSVTGGQLAQGHSISASFGASVTQVGKVQNKMSVAVFDAAKKDVTANYAVTVTDGLLEVTPRKLVLQSASDSKVYDGTPFTLEKYEVSEGSLADGQSEKVTFNASLTGVGSVQNAFAAVIYASDGVTDVTSNYDLSCLFGTLEITKRPLSVATESQNKVYDGTPLTNGNYEITAGSVAEGQNAEIEMTGSITGVGTAENALNVVIYDDGEDVTDNYRIEKQPGTLEVTKRPLSLKIGSDTKVYDGTALTDGEYEITAGEVAPEQTLSVLATGSQTTVGQSENAAAVTVTDSAGEDVTLNYSLTVTNGTLEVMPRKLVLQSASDSKVYDGTPLVREEYQVSEGSLAEGQSEGVTFNVSLTGVGSIQNEFAAVIYASDGETDVTSNYDLSCLYGTLEVTKRPLSLKIGDDTKVYDGTALTNGEYEITAGEVAPEQTLSVLTAGSQTTVGRCDNTAAVTIKDAAGENVTLNYALTVTNGTLEIMPRKLVLQSVSDSKVYDGTPLVREEYTASEGSLADGQSERVTFNASLTGVGSIKNEFAAVIYASDGVTDVTFNYDLSCLYGTLEVAARKLVLQSASDSKVYDGTPLVREEYTASEGSLAEGQSERVTFNASLTGVGSIQNEFAAVIYASDGVTDVTFNYDLSCLYGVLEVTPYRISISTYSSVKVYDGTPLSAQNYTVSSENQLIEGHEIDSVTMPSSRTDAGVEDNLITGIIIVDADGQDVTANYEIDYFFGKLSVSPRPITIRSASDSKEYNGTPLTCGDWEYVSITRPLEDHEVQVAVSGTRTEVGESDNTIAEVLILQDGQNVTENYDITLELGVLVVKGTTSGGSGGTTGDTDTSGNIGGGQTGDDTVAIRVYSDRNGKIYLRLMSFGDLNNAETKWMSALPYGQVLDGKYSYNYLSGIALNNAGASRSDVFIEVMGSDYYLPYYMTTDAGNYLIQTSDVRYEGSTDKVYNLTYFSYDIVGEGVLTGMLGQYSDAELAYRDWVYKNYTYISLSGRLEAYFNEITAQNGWDKEQDLAVLLGEVASFIQNAAAYNLDYNKTLDNSQDIVYDFLQVYKEGICQHYATAATVLLRYLGIPARYTVGYVGDTKAGEWVDITTKNAHAWVEVYVGGFGWVQLEVTGGGPGNPGGSDGDGGSGGSGGDGGAGGGGFLYSLSVKPVDEYMLFDGVSELTHSGTLQGLYDLEQKGYTYFAQVSGSRKALGFATSKIEKFILYDPDGNDVTDQFDIEFSEGVLQVYIGVIRIKTEGGQKVYDGTPLANGKYSLESELLDGHRIETEITGSQKNVGSSINTFSLKVWDEAGNDVTYMYRIIADYGILEVQAREITVTAKDAQKQADGTPLTCNEYIPLPEGALAPGQRIVVEITGSQTKVGYSDNVVRSVTIFDSDGNDVTANYIIKTQNGRLTVTL